MSEKLIYVSYKLTGFEREVFCDYCDRRLVKKNFDEAYCRFYQNDEGLYFETVLCPHCFNEEYYEMQGESLATEVVGFYEANIPFQKAIVETLL